MNSPLPGLPLLARSGLAVAQRRLGPTSSAWTSTTVRLSPSGVSQERARSWETPEGERRTVVEVQADEVGPSLRWTIVKPERAAGNGKPSGQFNDDPPF